MDNVVINGSTKKVRKLQKEKKVGTIAELCDNFNSLVDTKVKEHLTRIHHQFSKYQEVKSINTDTSAVMIIDFLKTMHVAMLRSLSLCILVHQDNRPLYTQV